MYRVTHLPRGGQPHWVYLLTPTGSILMGCPVGQQREVAYLRGVCRLLNLEVVG